MSKKKWFFFSLLALAVIFFRYRQLLFFTWDQGRDAFKLASLAAGDLTLIGPTSGLQGFFLGPLWYYAGLPGFWLGQGSPFIISAWYSLLTLTALPAIYLIIKKLLPKQKSRQDFYFFLFIISAGLIKAATMIWNPLLSVPLLAWSIYALLQKKKARWWLFVGFSLLGLLLQAEFAYGVFVVGGLWLALKFYRPKTNWLDYFIAAVGVVWTLLPQALFELKNNFLMSRSLWQGFINQEAKVSFLYLLTKRPLQNIYIMAEQLFGSGEVFYQFLVAGLIGLIFYQLWRAIKNRQLLQPQWRLIYLIFFLPLIGYSLWAGNHGNLFPYYITPHFIPLYLIIFHLVGHFSDTKLKWLRISISQLLLVLFLLINLRFVINRTFHKSYQTGILKSLGAIESVYRLAQARGVQQPVLKIFVPNIQTEHYDYLAQWYARQHNLPVVSTSYEEDDELRYILIEPHPRISEKSNIPGYEEITSGGRIEERRMSGELMIEEWVRVPELQVKSGLERSQ